MQAVGVITEYNPFHNGHHYHVTQAKQVTGADVVVAVMSGNFVQRGVPAVFDKWQRAELALDGGVDLVFELPFAFAVQPAHLFAQGAIRLLADAGVNSIVFGAEHAEWDFVALAKAVRGQSKTVATNFATYNQTYATNFNDSLETIIGYRIDTPNDLLGFAYANALLDFQLEDQIQLRPIQRTGANYHDKHINHEKIASATALRQLMAEKADQQAFVPYTGKKAAALLAQGPQVEDWWQKWFELLYYQVMMTPVSDLEQCYQLTDGLAYRLKDQMERLALPLTENSWQEFMITFKSKRYTWSRLQRTLLYVLLHITNDEMQYAMTVPYLRLLAANKVGRTYLKQQRKQFMLPMIHKVTKDDLTDLLRLDYRAGRLYQFCSTDEYKSIKQDTGRIPVFKERK